MEESALTNQAIAELMLEIEGPTATFSSHKQSERKVNPLGKANKRFLGRTINTAIRHNRREDERTQANCRQKLKDLDDIHERRKSNYFYNRDAIRNSRRSRSRSRSSSRSRSRRRVKSKKRCSRKRSSSRSSRSSSRSRSRSHRKKNKKKTRKHRKSHHKSRHRSSSSNSRDRNSSPGVALPTAISPPTEMYLEHSKQMALAMAMAYGQVLKANSLKAAAKERESSPMSDIVKELMSDDEEEENPDQVEALSISSNDGETKDNVLTIDVSSNSDSQSDSSAESSDLESEVAPSAGRCIVLDQSDNNTSDIEIIEEEKVPEAVNNEQQVKENSALESVDLTED